uniref:SERTA domain-containing protein 2b n=1 Tax=Scatophagus argus TaxID=75038 RepID=UPI001ED7E123|nr:SERTA domain-containing protein 2b [Scatophagus argus]XP_046257503.1 SERTA domain-containing protein 2b [Scatophagus argus]
MFGKGAKRKLDEDEEGLEGKTLEASVAGGGLGLGPEGLSKVSYTLQRQTIFNISLMKLYSQRPLGEPSLERRVLINNMLRRIQDELKQEGSLRPLLFPPSPPPDDPMDEGFREAPPSFGVLSATNTQVSQPSALLMPVIAPPSSPHPMVPPNCPASETCPNRAGVCPAPLEACLTPASLLEEDGGDSAFCVPSPPTPPLSPPPVQPPQLPSALLSQAPPRVPMPASSSDGFSSALSDMELGPPTAITRTAAANNTTVTTSPAPTPLTQPSHLASLSPATTGLSRDCRTMGAKPEAAGVLLAEGRCAELRPMDSLPTLPPAGLVDISSSPSSPSSSSSPSGFLSDLALDDVLFADIDTSMYDFDPCMTAGAVGVMTGGGLAKLSPVVTADDLLKSFASPYSGPTPQVSANQPFKIDLTELDHIMEVLVGS